jgi:hypothetical protein
MHSKTVDYSEDLYGKIMENMADYNQTGETVCGAQDPAVISLNEPLAEFPEFTMVRVVDRYINPWNSSTLLIFSNVAITDEEYTDYERFVYGGE